MSLQRFVIADLKVEMNVRFDLLKSRSEKYLADFLGEPDIFIETTDRQLELIKKEMPKLTAEEGEYMCTSAIFYNKLLEFDGFLLHSSAVSYGGKAYMFTADCGTGKSTHSRLWREYVGSDVGIINDDKPAVRLINGKFYAIGTPWSGKTDQNDNIAVPVGGVALLNRGKVNKIEPADRLPTVMALLRQTFFPSSRQNTDKMAELMDKFIRCVPVYRLECDMSEDAVKTSFEAMTGTKYIKGK